MTKAQMLAYLKREFDEQYFEWQLSEAILEDESEPIDDVSRNCVERCAIREFEACETIARITKQFFDIDLMEFVN